MERVGPKPHISPGAGRLPWRRKPRFIYPIPPPPRTAVLSTKLRPGGPVRILDPAANGCIAALRSFAPEAVAATLAQLESLIGTVSLTHAVIVFRAESDPRLTESERDRLWQAFQVPAFEQIIAPDGTLLAAECEAHEGLHIESAGFAAAHQLDLTPCPCGRPGARLAFSAAEKPIRVAAAPSI